MKFPPPSITPRHPDPHNQISSLPQTRRMSSSVSKAHQWMADRPTLFPWWTVVQEAGMPWHLIIDVAKFIGPSQQQKDVINQLKRHLSYIAICPMAFEPRPNPGKLYPLGPVWVLDWTCRPAKARDIGLNCNKYCTRLGCGCKCDETGVLRYYCGCSFVPDAENHGTYAGYVIRFTIPPALEIQPYGRYCGLLLNGIGWDRCMWSRMSSSYYNQGNLTFGNGTHPDITE